MRKIPKGMNRLSQSQQKSGFALPPHGSLGATAGLSARMERS